MEYSSSMKQQKRFAGPVMGLIYAFLIAISNMRNYFLLVNIPWYAT